MCYRKDESVKWKWKKNSYIPDSIRLHKIYLSRKTNNFGKIWEQYQLFITVFNFFLLKIMRINMFQRNKIQYHVTSYLQNINFLKCHLYSKTTVTQTNPIGAPRGPTSQMVISYVKSNGEQIFWTQFDAESWNGYIQVPPSAAQQALPLFPNPSPGLSVIQLLDYYRLQLPELKMD